jgi:hypothetical protein
MTLGFLRLSGHARRTFVTHVWHGLERVEQYQMLSRSVTAVVSSGKVEHHVDRAREGDGCRWVDDLQLAPDQRLVSDRELNSERSTDSWPNFFLINARAAIAVIEGSNAFGCRWRWAGGCKLRLCEGSWCLDWFSS